MNKELIINRLALIKYLYKLGIDQSEQSEPMAAFSILHLHDSVEMFLKLLAEYKNVKSDNFNFLDYWASIPSLTLKESMRNLNARRVNIKHKGLLPSKTDIEISRASTTEFFEQNTESHFGLKFIEISLLDLIHNESVKSYLEKSIKASEIGKFDECIENVSIAFEELIYTYEESKTSWRSSSPFYFGKDFTFLGSFSVGIGAELGGNVGRKIDEFIDNVKDSLEEIKKAIKILSFGIDYKKYSKFKLLTPIVRRTVGGEYRVELWGEKKWNHNNCQFCIDFVLESCLKLQEFDFDIKDLIVDEVPQLYFTEIENKQDE